MRVVVPVEKGEVEVALPLLLVVIVTKGGRRIPPTEIHTRVHIGGCSVKTPKVSRQPSYLAHS